MQFAINASQDLGHLPLRWLLTDAEKAARGRSFGMCRLTTHEMFWPDLTAYLGYKPKPQIDRRNGRIAAPVYIRLGRFYFLPIVLDCGQQGRPVGVHDCATK